MRIAVIDYNAGNIASVTHALNHLGYDYTVTCDPKTILAADKVIFPGQGRAAPAMKDLRASGLDDVLKKIEVPFLGICLGMQLLFSHSEEDDTKCLDILPGCVTRFDVRSCHKVPQMGWNTVQQSRTSPLFSDIPDVFYTYYAHSFFVPADEAYTLAHSIYGSTKIASIVQKNNFFGVQFHPEKSGDVGMQILKNFCELETVQNKTLILPAIDIINGQCVRLYQGDYDKQTTYGNSPLTQANAFVEKGAQYLHIIDLEGAKDGAPKNADVIISVAKSVSIPVQTGGGIRTRESARYYLDNGVSRIILSTSAISDPDMIRELIAEYGPGRVVVSIDARDEKVAIKGWREESSLTVTELLNSLRPLGVTTIIYTDIKSDGTLKGPNYAALQKVLGLGFKVIAAGGMTAVEDVAELNVKGVYGAIVGKALYEGSFDLESATRIPQPVIRRPFVRPTRDVSKRVIACMDIANGRVVKGAHFTDLRDAGDPVELGKLYSDNGADELVFLDINATIENRKTLCELVTAIAKRITIPFTVGGGVRSITDIKNLLKAGADKVSIGSAAVTNPEFVGEAAREFGSQCIVISVDPKKVGSKWELFIKGGRVATGKDAVQFCKDMQEQGAGELLVNSLDRDGTEKGYDVELLKAISEVVSIPVIASSGAGTQEHFLEAITEGHADAVLAATLFHYGKIAIPDLKKYLSERNIAIRL